MNIDTLKQGDDFPCLVTLSEPLGGNLAVVISNPSTDETIIFRKAVDGEEEGTFNKNVGTFTQADELNYQFVIPSSKTRTMEAGTYDIEITAEIGESNFRKTSREHVTLTIERSVSGRKFKS